MAGGEEDQRQRPARGPERGGQLFGGDGVRVALLGLELEHARAAVAREVQDVVLVAPEGGGDRVLVADLQDLHFGLLAELLVLHGVEDVLELALEVEHGVLRPRLVGRGDGDEHLERAGQGVAGPGLGHGPGQAQRGERGRPREERAAGSAQRVDRQPEHPRVVGD